MDNWDMREETGVPNMANCKDFEKDKRAGNSPGNTEDRALRP